MDLLAITALALVTATGIWAYMRLNERIALLEHEVRWLRQEIEELKPNEVKSAFDRP